MSSRSKKRISAAFIDYTIVVCSYGILLWLVILIANNFLPLPWRGAHNHDTLSWYLIDRLHLYAVVCLFSSWIVLSIAYFAFFESSRLQATPGKLLLGLKVTSTGGNKLAFLQSALKMLMQYMWVTFAPAALYLSVFLLCKFLLWLGEFLPDKTTTLGYLGGMTIFIALILLFFLCIPGTFFLWSFACRPQSNNPNQSRLDHLAGRSVLLNDSIRSIEARERQWEKHSILVKILVLLFLLFCPALIAEGLITVMCNESSLISMLILKDKYVRQAQMKETNEREKEFEAVIGISPNDCIKNIQAGYISAIMDPEWVLFFEYTNEKSLCNLLKEADLKENEEAQPFSVSDIEECPAWWKAERNKVLTRYDRDYQRGKSKGRHQLSVWIDKANRSCVASTW